MGLDGNLMVYKGNESVENLTEEFEILIKSRMKKNGDSVEDNFHKKLYNVNNKKYIFMYNHFFNMSFDFLEDQEVQEDQKQWAEIYEQEYDICVNFCIGTSLGGIITTIFYRLSMIIFRNMRNTIYHLLQLRVMLF